MRKVTDLVDLGDRQKATETLYGLLSNAYAAEQDTYEWVDAKAGRYLTAVAVVLGAASLKLDEVSRLVRMAELDGTLRLAFGGAYLLTFLLALAAMVASLLTMQVEDVPALPLDHQLPALFDRNAYEPALHAMAEGFRAEAWRLRQVNRRRSARLRVASRLLYGVLGGILLTALLYIPVRLQEPAAAVEKKSHDATSLPVSAVASMGPQRSAVAPAPFSERATHGTEANHE